jgi:hypothetical protein
MTAYAWETRAKPDSEDFAPDAMDQWRTDLYALVNDMGGLWVDAKTRRLP